MQCNFMISTSKSLLVIMSLKPLLQRVTRRVDGMQELLTLTNLNRTRYQFNIVQPNQLHYLCCCKNMLRSYIANISIRYFCQCGKNECLIKYITCYSFVATLPAVQLRIRSMIKKHSYYGIPVFSGSLSAYIFL